MYLGIDVGGTFTDAVAIADGLIIAQAKSPTTDDLLSGILASLDTVLAGTGSESIERVALSTTFVTNSLVQGKISKVGLFLIPGPGLDPSGFVPTPPIILDGYIDHRGRETASVRQEQVKEACRLSQFEAVAISGKFSVRNPIHEAQVASWLADCAPTCHITRGGEVSGGLNFLRRSNSAYYNAAVWRCFGLFADAAAEALRQRGIKAPIYILKADGGTLPLEQARRCPVETIFTGPAASVLGILAMAKPEQQAISLDIGGTTTDIALWRNGLPLFAPRGATLQGYNTAVRAFRLRSVALGGDSAIRRKTAITVGPDRCGPAAAVGGTVPTLSDALIVAGYLDFGDKQAARQSISQLSCTGQTIEETAAEIIAVAVEHITREIQQMIEEHFSEPVYRVNDIMHSEPLQPEVIIGVGGAAKGLAPLVANRWAECSGRACVCHTPPAAVVANAVGAAVARPTVSVTVRADTSQGQYVVSELGLSQRLSSRRTTLDDVKNLAQNYLVSQAETRGIQADSVEISLMEEFNLVRGFDTIGKNILVQLQVKPGVLCDVPGKEVAM